MLEGDPYNIFGWLTILFSMSYKLPIIITGVNKLSIGFLLLQTISYIFAVVHGMLIKDAPILILNILAIGQNMILYKKLYLHNNIVKTDIVKTDTDVVDGAVVYNINKMDV